MAIDRTRSSLSETPVARYSFSAGIALHAQGLAIEQLLERADRALYAAKHAGRACSVVAQGSIEVEAL